MGSGRIFTCPGCGRLLRFSFGVGWMMPGPALLKRRKDVDDVLDFSERYPDGYVVYERVVKRCKNCGNLSNDMDLSMYVMKSPVRHAHHFVQVLGNNISLEEARSGKYKKYKDHLAPCQRCGCTEWEAFDEPGLKEEMEKGNICCPDCGKVLTADMMTGYYMWD